MQTKEKGKNKRWKTPRRGKIKGQQCGEAGKNFIAHPACTGTPSAWLLACRQVAAGSCAAIPNGRCERRREGHQRPLRCCSTKKVRNCASVAAPVGNAGRGVGRLFARTCRAPAGPLGRHREGVACARLVGCGNSRAHGVLTAARAAGPKAPIHQLALQWKKLVRRQ